MVPTGDAFVQCKGTSSGSCKVVLTGIPAGSNHHSRIIDSGRMREDSNVSSKWVELLKPKMKQLEGRTWGRMLQGRSFHSAKLAGNALVERYQKTYADLDVDPYNPMSHDVKPAVRLNGPSRRRCVVQYDGTCSGSSRWC